MPPEVQVKILRVLQDGTFERLGSTRTLQVDVRVVAATNKDLMQEVEAGRWRLDLYYRLNVISLRLPALRERREDIPLLVAHFLRKYAVQNNKQVSGIQQQVLQSCNTPTGREMCVSWRTSSSGQWCWPKTPSLASPNCQAIFRRGTYAYTRRSFRPTP